jgi:hypothetical protein
MKSLYIESTAKTPEIIFDPERNVFDIKGKSIPDDAEHFYRDVLEWFDDYLVQPNNETVVTIDLEYFNIASSKRLLFILYKLNELVEANKNVRVKWCYNEEDEDMFEVGQDYAFMVNVPFDFVSYRMDELNLVL